MATLGIEGPFEQDQPLAPGELVWVQLGERDGYRDCAVAVTAAGSGDQGGTYVLRVEDVAVSCVHTWEGDIDYSAWHLGCNVRNVGDVAVQRWWVTVGVVHV